MRVTKALVALLKIQCWALEEGIQRNFHLPYRSLAAGLIGRYNGFLKKTSDLSSVQFSSVQLLSRVRLFATPWIAAHQASLSITSSRSTLRLTSIESVLPSSHLILCSLLLLLPPILPRIRVFSHESTLCMRSPKYWSFSFSIIPSKEIPGLISFKWDDISIVKDKFSEFNHIKRWLEVSHV